MLIYNYQKEFLGIDEKDLRSLGFNNLADLRTEVSDFADLFVKTPGYIHNFKHVHWIDFITCADSNEESKVIINVNNKNYKAIVQITTAFLVDNPSTKAYLIQLNNLRELSAKESESISGDITQRVTHQAVAEPKQIFNTPEYSEDFTPDTSLIPEQISTPSVVTPDPYETPLEINLSESDDTPLNIDIDTQEEPFTQTQKAPIDDTYEAPLEIDMNDDFFEEEKIIPEIKETPTKVIIENYDNGYMYDPNIASDELGLPLELIEEFIQDFIEQAKEFKTGLYQALDDNDLDNLKILSHKLKGVAANLRIEDALEVLTIINTSSDFLVIRENLDILYKIIAKLAGEGVASEVIIQSETEEKIKEEVLENNENISQKIDLPQTDLPQLELEDDIFEENQTLDLLDIDDFDDNVSLKIQEEDLPSLNYSKTTKANEIGIDEESFNELFDDYLMEANTLVDSITKAIEAQEYLHSQEKALQLKGMSDNMKINAFTKELEVLVNSQDQNELRATIKTVRAYLAQLAQQ